MFRSVIEFFRKLFTSAPPIAWGQGEGSDPIRWEIDRAGNLLFDGRDTTPYHQWSKEELTECVRMARRRIKDSDDPLVLEAVLIEEHLAMSLWQQGVLTRDMLENSKPCVNGGLEFSLKFDGEVLPVMIQRNAYSPDYEFIVSGHPQGLVRLRDVPDLLHALSGEPAN